NLPIIAKLSHAAFDIFSCDKQKLNLLTDCQICASCRAADGVGTYNDFFGILELTAGVRLLAENLQRPWPKLIERRIFRKGNTATVEGREVMNKLTPEIGVKTALIYGVDAIRAHV